MRCDNQKLCHFKWRRCHTVQRHNKWILRLKKAERNAHTKTKWLHIKFFPPYTHGSPGGPLNTKHGWTAIEKSHRDPQIISLHEELRKVNIHSFILNTEYHIVLYKQNTEHWTARCHNYSLGHNHKQPGMCLGWQHPALHTCMSYLDLKFYSKSCTEVYTMIGNWSSNKSNMEFTSPPLSLNQMPLTALHPVLLSLFLTVHNKCLSATLSRR